QRQLVEADPTNLVTSEPALSPLVEPELPAAPVQVPEQPEPIATAAVVQVEPMPVVEPAPVVAAEPVQVAEATQPDEAVQPVEIVQPVEAAQAADKIPQNAEPAQPEPSVEIVKEPVAV